MPLCLQPVQSLRPAMKTLAHLSDLHFGTVDPDIRRGLERRLLELQPDLVVVSGDLTQRARQGQFRAARRFLDALPFPRVVVPGNHDLPLYSLHHRFTLPLGNYKRYITPDLSPAYRDGEVAVLGLNTTRPYRHTEGRISLAQLRRTRERLCALPDSVFRVLVTHHPFLPPPHRKKPLVGKAERALRYLETCNLSMILSGHFHMSYAGGSHATYTALQRSVLVIQAGTAISRRTRNECNAFNLIRIGQNHVTLDVQMWYEDNFSTSRTEVYRQNQQDKWELCSNHRT